MAEQQLFHKPWTDSFDAAIKKGGPDHSDYNRAGSLFLNFQPAAEKVATTEDEFNQAILDHLLSNAIDTPDSYFTCFTRCIPQAAAGLKTAEICRVMAQAHTIHVDPAYHYTIFCREWMDVYELSTNTQHSNCMERFWRSFLIWRSRFFAFGSAKSQSTNYFNTAQGAAMEVGVRVAHYMSFVWEERGRQLGMGGAEAWNKAIEAAIQNLDYVVKTVHPSRDASAIYEAKRNVWRLGNEFYKLFPGQHHLHVLGWDRLQEFYPAHR